MQMQNGSAGFCCLDRLARNVFGRERKVRRHGRGMDRPRDGAADDYLVVHERANYTVSKVYSFTKTIRLPSGSWTVSLFKTQLLVEIAGAV